MRNVALISTLACIATFGCKQMNTDDQGKIASTGAHSHQDFFGPIPGNLDRQLTCPGVENKTPAATFNGKKVRYMNSSEIDYSNSGWVSRAPADWNALTGLDLGNMEAVVIDIRRVNGKPYYFYMSNGKQNKTYEPWSSSKFMAAASAGSRARKESGGKVGLNASSGSYHLGDMISAMHSYTPVGNASDNSNAHAMYFLTRAGRAYTTNLFKDGWLKIADNSVFKGGYGENPFDTASSMWKTSAGASVSMPDRDEPYESKDMTALVQAEFLKRLTQHATDPATAMPNITAEDLGVLMYGNPNRTGIGGMLMGDSTYMAEGLMGGMPLGRYTGGFGGPENEPAKRYFDSSTGGKWRIFQKSGLGISSTRGMSEVVMASYACLPTFDGGREFVIVTSAHVKGEDATAVSAADKMTTAAFNKIVPLVVPGFIPKK
jgi:hypothetical protein